MKYLIVVGNDKLGRKLITQLSHCNDLKIAIDCSSNISRLWRLVFIKRVIPIGALIKMFFAELTRKDFPHLNFPKIYNNDDLSKILTEESISCVYLFRAGLIIDKKLLSSKINIFNLHCAKIPEYAGLGSIYKSLKAKDFDQEISLHKVVEKIDSGELIGASSYKLDPKLSYRENEDIAYDTGIKYLVMHLSKRLKCLT